MDVTILGFTLAIETYIWLLQIIALVLFLLLAFFYNAAGKWMMAYGKAVLKRGKVAIEYDKTKEFNPFCANIPKEWKSVIELPNMRGIIGIRRESIGHSNKIQTMLFSSEFEYTVSPREISGERYFSIDDKNPDHLVYAYPFNDQLIKITKEEFESGKYPTAKMWIRHPTETVTPEEFVKFQSINADPMLTEGYAQYKELKLKEKMMNPIRAMLAENGHLIIMAIIVGAIAYQIVTNQNYGLSKADDLQACKDTIIHMYDTGVCSIRNMTTYEPSINVSKITTGGMIT